MPGPLNASSSRSARVTRLLSVSWGDSAAATRVEDLAVLVVQRHDPVVDRCQQVPATLRREPEDHGLGNRTEGVAAASLEEGADDDHLVTAQRLDLASLLVLAHPSELGGLVLEELEVLVDLRGRVGGASLGPGGRLRLRLRHPVGDHVHQPLEPVPLVSEASARPVPDVVARPAGRGVEGVGVGLELSVDLAYRAGMERPHGLHAFVEPVLGRPVVDPGLAFVVGEDRIRLLLDEGRPLGGVLLVDDLLVESSRAIVRASLLVHLVCQCGLELDRRRLVGDHPLSGFAGDDLDETVAVGPDLARVDVAASRRGTLLHLVVDHRVPFGDRAREHRVGGHDVLAGSVQRAAEIGLDRLAVGAQAGPGRRDLLVQHLLAVTRRSGHAAKLLVHVAPFAWNQRRREVRPCVAELAVVGDADGVVDHALGVLLRLGQQPGHDGADVGLGAGACVADGCLRDLATHRRTGCRRPDGHLGGRSGGRLRLLGGAGVLVTFGAGPPPLGRAPLGGLRLDGGGQRRGVGRDLGQVLSGRDHHRRQGVAGEGAAEQRVDPADHGLGLVVGVRRQVGRTGRLRDGLLRLVRDAARLLDPLVLRRLTGLGEGRSLSALERGPSYARHGLVDLRLPRSQRTPVVAAPFPGRALRPGSRRPGLGPALRLGDLSLGSGGLALGDRGPALLGGAGRLGLRPFRGLGCRAARRRSPLGGLACRLHRPLGRHGGRRGPRCHGRRTRLRGSGLEERQVEEVEEVERRTEQIDEPVETQLAQGDEDGVGGDRWGRDGRWCRSGHAGGRARGRFASHHR